MRADYPNHANSHFTRDFRSSYECLVLYQREKFSCSLNGHTGPILLSSYFNLFRTHDILLVSLLRSTPNHTPFIYRCPYLVGVGWTPVYHVINRKTRTIPLNEVIWQCNRAKRPVVSVPGSGHPHDIDTRCIDFLNRAPCRKKVESSSRIDFYRVLEMGRHQLMDGMQYAQLTMMSNNRRFRHGMTPRAGREQKREVRSAI